MSRYKYILTFEVEDGGCRKFEAKGECESQGRMKGDVAFDIKRMLSIMNDPPSGSRLLGLLEERGWLWCLATLIDDEWEGESDLEDAFEVTVDLDVLAPNADAKKRAYLESLTKYHGIRVKEKVNEESKGEK